MDIAYFMCFLAVCLMISVWVMTPRDKFMKQLILENNKMLRLLAVKHLGIDEENLDKLLK